MKGVAAIVVAAGGGKRFKSKTPKPLAEINRKPVIIYSLQALSRSPLIKEIIVVVNDKNRSGIIKKIGRYRIAKVRKVVKGGARRQDSVANGLKALDPDAEMVLIHDAARPFINRDIIASTVRAAGIHGAAIAAVPVKATIKDVRGGFVGRTLPRERLWEVQTPQVFRRGLIAKAYKKFNRVSVTDDAALAEKSGIKVRVVMGAYGNIKITTREDLLVAKRLA